MKMQYDDIVIEPYKSYIYSYPHKKAYEEFDEEINLEVLWKKSNKKDITLYIHIPFCMSKCGYCNLFSSVDMNKEKIDKYVNTLIKEIKAVARFLNIENNESPFSSVIFGGGTPTILEDNQLENLLCEISRNLKVDFKKTFFAVETSPRTLTESKLRILKDFGIDRVSMGIQSFNGCELKSIYRMEPIKDIEKALKLLFKESMPIRNLDLIYGIPNQDLNSWRESLNLLIEYKPEEVFIYPLYIRENTPLYSKYKRDNELMLKMYELGRNILLENGYIQTSMRNFIREDKKIDLFPEYSCQENEMIGIGCGARSYISNVNYSRKYGVFQNNINKIIDDYINEKDFTVARHGYILSEDELKRRYILKSILKVSGLDMMDYHTKFKSNPVDEFEELNFLLENNFLVKDENNIYPTEKGIMYGDSIGQLFISSEVKKKIDKYEER